MAWRRRSGSGVDDHGPVGVGLQADLQDLALAEAGALTYHRTTIDAPPSPPPSPPPPPPSSLGPQPTASFLRIEPTRRIHTYGIGVSIMAVARDPLHNGPRSITVTADRHPTDP